MTKVVDIYIDEVIEREETEQEKAERDALQEEYLAGKQAEELKQEAFALLKFYKRSTHLLSTIQSKPLIKLVNLREGTQGLLLIVKFQHC